MIRPAASLPPSGVALPALGQAAPAAALKAKETARDFEALLLGELLKQSRKTLGDDGGFFGQDKADNYGALFDFFLGKHVADSGGVGVAAAIQAQLTGGKR
jgi:Rod binding domain-containing protein